MITMKITLLQLLLVSLCIMHATSLPRASVTMPQAVESPSQPAAVTVAAELESGVNEVNKAMPSSVVSGDEVSAAAAQLMQLLPADELPSGSAECGKVGEFCNLADDCCTKRCLSYAKRCVT
ncbi:uncharacterized protein [Bactrocera oleae]|uniref:uncharacterized protein isoform X1 n=1 Tax=Bactrocera oleae TaxID=104688 RepID=UPI00387E7699